jgi:hypothetical protein
MVGVADVDGTPLLPPPQEANSTARLLPKSTLKGYNGIMFSNAGLHGSPRGNLRISLVLRVQS